MVLPKCKNCHSKRMLHKKVSGGRILLVYQACFYHRIFIERKNMNFNDAVDFASNNDREKEMNEGLTADE